MIEYNVHLKVEWQEINDKNDVMEIIFWQCKNWLGESKNSKFKSIDFPENLNKVADNRLGSYKITTKDAKEEVEFIAGYGKLKKSDCYLGFQYLKLDHKSKISWQTTIVGVCNYEQRFCQISIVLERKFDGFVNRTIKSSKPKVIELIVNSLVKSNFSVSDGLFEIKKQLYILTSNKSNVALIQSILNGRRKEKFLPIVYISYGHKYHKGDLKQLVDKLFGIAHVFIEEDKDLAFNLKKKVDFRNVYGGAIGIYYSSGNVDNLYYKFEEYNPPINKIVNEMLKFSNRQLIDTALTWNNIQKKNSDRILLSFEQEKINFKNENEDLFKIFESMEANNKKLIDEVNSRNEELEKIKEELSIAQSNLVRKNFDNKNLKSDKHSTSKFSLKISESNLYLNEIEYYVIHMLKEHPLYGHHQRLTDIADDLFNCNVEEYRSIENGITDLKNALNGYKSPDAKIRKALNYFNIELAEEGKHFKAKFNQENRYAVTLGKSASDCKAGVNNFHYFMKEMLLKPK